MRSSISATTGWARSAAACITSVMAPMLSFDRWTVRRYHWMLLIGSRPSSLSVTIRLIRFGPKRRLSHMSGPQRRARSPLLAPPEDRSPPVPAGPIRLTVPFHTQGTHRVHVPPDAWVPSSAGRSRADAVSSVPSSPDDAGWWTAYCQASFSFLRDSAELPASLHADAARQSPPAAWQSPPAASPDSHSAGLLQLPPLPYHTTAKRYASGSWVHPLDSEQLPLQRSVDSLCVFC